MKPHQNRNSTINSPNISFTEPTVSITITPTQIPLRAGGIIVSINDVSDILAGGFRVIVSPV